MIPRGLWLSRAGQRRAYLGRRRRLSHAAKAKDVVICGAGIMGLNVAYQLKCRDAALQVTVLERANGLGHGSSGWSTGFLRAFYSFDETMKFALDGMHAYKNWAAYTGLAMPRAGFTETGALWMLGKGPDDNEALRRRLAAFGVASEILDAAGVQDRFPALATDPYPEHDAVTGEETGRAFPALSALYEEGCGHLCSSACMEDLVEACRREGVEVRFGAGVAAVLQQKGRAGGVELEDGSRVAAGVVVNCLGPWFQRLNETCGVTTSTTMRPIRVQVGHVGLDDEELLRLPFVADAHGASGIYFMPRRANRQLLFGSIDPRFEAEEVPDPDALDPTLDANVEADFLGSLLHRLPTLPRRGRVVGFSHLYTVNQEDLHPVIGESSLAGYMLCHGFSGHGFKLAPAVGALVAQQILGGTAPASRMAAFDTDVPRDFFKADRSPLTFTVKTHFA